MNLHEALAAANIPAPPPNLRPMSGGFARYGKENRYWIKQHDGVALFGDWTTGASHQWFEDSDKPLDAQTVAARKAKTDEMRTQQEQEQTKVYDENAARAEELWNTMTKAGSSAYLDRKQVEALGIRFGNDSIAIPLRDVDGNLWSLQFIQPNGEKRFLTGGKKRGCFHAIGEIGEEVIVGEGYATLASIHMATGATCIVAFDAGNLEPVVQALRSKYPNMRITLAADNDCWKPESDNVGKDKAEAVAKKYGCKVILPQFSETVKATQPTDFNDLHVLEGLEAVRAQFESVRGLDCTGLVVPPAETPAATVARLAQLTPLEYEQVREVEAKRLGIKRLSVLDKQVDAERKMGNAAIGKAALFQPVTPWHEPVDANALLQEIATTLRRFIVCDPEIIIAASLWCAFTWIIDHVQVAPIAMITAPEKQCGKSQLLTLIGKLSNRPLVASNITTQSLFRVVEAFSPTLLIDEADSFMRENEDLRGIINSGHTRQSAFAIRCVGDNHEPTRFSTWGAKAISGIGSLPDTIMDRAIIFNLRRKLPGEEVERLRHADRELFETLAAKLYRFAADAGDTIAAARPVIPESLSDRAQDNWEPLLAIADYASGDWPELAREVAQKISGVEQATLSLSAELLADICEVFETKRVNRISTADLIEALCADDEKSWAAYNRGQPIKPRQIAKRLGEYDIKSKTVRIGYDTPKGFERAQFEDAFIRYLSPIPHVNATAQQTSANLNNPVADTIACCTTDLQSATVKPSLTNDCGVAADFLSPTADTAMVEVTL